jgi:hypothetical protein
MGCGEGRRWDAGMDRVAGGERRHHSQCGGCDPDVAWGDLVRQSGASDLDTAKKRSDILKCGASGGLSSATARNTPRAAKARRQGRWTTSFPSLA